MGFLKKLFSTGKSKEYVDTRGLYFYAQCDQCGSRVRVRADKQNDLNRDGEGFVWHKTIVDNRCFRQMPVVVHLDGNYRVRSQEIEGGQFISKELYEQPEADLPAAGE